MLKTTIYLSHDLKLRLERAAALRDSSEAEVIRDAIEQFVAADERPRPRLPLFAGDGLQANVAERAEEILADGFGRD